MQKSYYYDCEFLEGKQVYYNLGIKTDYWLRIFGSFFLILAALTNVYFIHDLLCNSITVVFALSGLLLFSLSFDTPNTIDLISIGFISDDNREYYAVSKDFNLRDAWNRYDLKETRVAYNSYGEKETTKVYWIRENVLKPIFEELAFKEYMSLTNKEAVEFTDIIKSSSNPLEFFKSEFLYKMNIHYWKFSYKNLERLILKYGKSNKQIAEEIKEFIYIGLDDCTITRNFNKNGDISIMGFPTNDYPIFYGYYSAYDHVVMCWLFGKMIDLPKGFPMYTFDLQQELINKMIKDDSGKLVGLQFIKKRPDYPPEPKVHHALLDAKWNKELHYFLNLL